MNQAAGFAITSEPELALAPAASPLAALEHAALPLETLRTLVHAMRQPLSSIETIAFYLSMVLPPEDEKVQALLREIRMLVEQSNRILSEELAPALNPRSGDTIPANSCNAHTGA